jgi:Na+/H+-dicarboxylate symporter
LAPATPGCANVAGGLKIENRVGIGLFLGVAAGAYFGEDAAVVEPLGTLFIRLIRMLIVPLVASSLVLAIAGLPGRAALGRLGLRAFTFIIVSLFVAIVIGIVLAAALGPGSAFSPEARTSLLEGRRAPDVDPDAPRPSIVETLIGVVPDNPIRAAVDGNVLQVLFVAILLGLAASALPEDRRKPLVDLARSVTETLFKLTGWILELAPFGVFGLMAAVVGRAGLSVLVGLSAYVGVVVLALAVHIVVYGAVVKLVARQSLKRFGEAAKPPFLIAFASCSTAAALPVSMATMQQTMGLSSRVASFVLPLGAAIGRDGSAIYQAISVLFIAQVYGVALGGQDYMTLVVMAMLSALAVAPVPAASFVNLAIILAALGLPLEGAALVLGVERPLDMARSSTNLLGHLVNATWVGTAEREINVSPQD